MHATCLRRVYAGPIAPDLATDAGVSWPKNVGLP
jgi:hypothetical protein